MAQRLGTIAFQCPVVLASGVIMGETTPGGCGDGKPIQFFGSGDTLSPGTSAYVVLSDPLPPYVAFGLSKEAFGEPEQVERIQLQ